jgi:flagellar biosynthesis protein FliQ
MNVTVVITVAMVWRLLSAMVQAAAGLTPRRLRFAPRSVHVGFVAAGQVSLRVLRLSYVNIIPPWLYVHLYRLEDEEMARW